MTVLTLKLLGPIRVEREGIAIRGFRSQKTLALLGYLAAEQRPVSRMYLAGLFWGDLAEAKPQGELRRALHNLASLMPGCLQSDRRIVQFVAGTVCRVDLTMFETLQAKGDMTALAAAVDLYQGDFMEDIYLNDCPDFETWLLAEREYWRQKMARGLQNLIIYHTHRGDYDLSLEFANRLLIFEPWNEKAHRYLMLLLARTGQRSAALAQYETCCRILAETLDAEPALETRQLYERIKISRSVPAHNLPPSPTPFIGREEELAEIRRYLANPDCRLLTVLGLGGIGKSRLARQAAASVVGDTARFFLHGVWSVSLVGDESAELLVSIIANALNIAFHSRAPAETQLLDYLRQKEMLLLLDNYEHLLPQTGLLRRILEQAPEVKLLVTSRQRLNLRQEWLFEMEGLPYPEWDEFGADPEALQAFDAVRLFESSARRAQHHFSLSEVRRDVIRICQLVEGLPLALELAAGRLTMLSCTEVVQEIEHSLDILTGQWSNVPTRHRSLRAVFEASWASLTPVEQATMRKISVFRGGFDPAAAVEVTGATKSVLTALVDKSLLHLMPSERYEVHELLRQYAAEKLAVHPGEVEATQAGHGSYYTTFLAQREQALKGPRQREILAEIRAEMGNVRSAWQWAVQTGNLEAMEQGLEALIFFHEYQGWYPEWKMLIEQTLAGLDWLDETEPQQGRFKGRLLMWYSHVQGHVGNLVKAKILAQQSIQLLRQYGPPRDEGMALMVVDYVLSLQDDAVKAGRHSSEVLRLVKSGNDLWDLAFAMGNRGLIAAREGEVGWAEAEQYLQMAKGYIQELGDPWLSTGLQRALGELYLRQGKLQAARRHFQTGLHLARQTTYRWDEEFALLNLGRIAQQLGEFHQARQYYEESIIVSRDLGERYDLARAHYHLGQVCRAEGALRQALQQFQTSLALRREIEDQQGIAVCLEALAEVATALNQDEADQQ